MIVALVVLVLFGGSRLPGLARSIGQAQKEFRKGLADGYKDDDDVKADAGKAAPEPSTDKPATGGAPAAATPGGGASASAAPPAERGEGQPQAAHSEPAPGPAAQA